MFYETKIECECFKVKLQALATQYSDQSQSLEYQLKSNIKLSEKNYHNLEAIAANLALQQSELHKKRSKIKGIIKGRCLQRETLELDMRYIISSIKCAITKDSNNKKLCCAREEVSKLKSTIAYCDDQAVAAEQRAIQSQEKLQKVEILREVIHMELHAIETEQRTLTQLFDNVSHNERVMIDQIFVSKSYKTALGAALGEDLDYEKHYALADLIKSNHHD
ncbi:MAG: hypothetical protein HRT83_00620 [Hyphomicrobiaceae bacterium]|nr:hypothetical protein [Hyphomicrobiaceae bacterium]